jgi:hypothetical protein
MQYDSVCIHAFNIFRTKDTDFRGILQLQIAELRMQIVLHVILH